MINFKANDLDKLHDISTMLVVTSLASQTDIKTEFITDMIGIIGSQLKAIIDDIEK